MSPADMMEGNLPWQVEVHFACRPSQKAMNPQVSILHQVVRNGIAKGVGHLSVDSVSVLSPVISLEGKEVLNFSSCSYLGLEHHENLVEGTVEAVRKYGTQYSSSRTFSRVALYDELEETLGRVFGAHVVATPTTTLGHQAALPSLVGAEDVILLDHHVHSSVQMAAKLVQASGTTVRLLPHNDLDKLDAMLKAHGSKGEKVWYLVDGIYSMYGNGAPIQALMERLDRFHHFHLYVDDAHGMSWMGSRGQGYILSQVELHERMVLATSLNKAFSAAGGAIVTARRDWHERILHTGGPLLFSGPIQPPMMGAAIASAKLHLSGDLAPLQHQLRQNIDQVRSGLTARGLPVACDAPTPIFFVPCGLPEVAYDVLKDMRSSGFCASAGVFPAVSMKRGGVRFTVTARHSDSDIQCFLDALSEHHPRVMERHGMDRHTLDRLFSSYAKQKTPELPKKEAECTGLNVRVVSSCSALDREAWDRMFGKEDVDSFEGLRMQESVFAADAIQCPDDWVYRYVHVTDQDGRSVLGTYLTGALTKADMLSEKHVSERMEALRTQSDGVGFQKLVMVGSLLSEGKVFVDRDHPDAQKALALLLSEAERFQSQLDAEGVMLRGLADAPVSEKDMLDRGWVSVSLPDTHEVSSMDWTTPEGFLEGLRSRYRYSVRREILPHVDRFEVRTSGDLDKAEKEHLFGLYQQVKSRALEINTFELPKTWFMAMMDSADWDVIRLYLKDGGNDGMPVAVMFSHRNGAVYSAKFVGLDYGFNGSHNVYKQALYQCVLRARELGCSEVKLGLTATIEKKKLGASVIPQRGFVKMDDHFTIDQMRWAS